MASAVENCGGEQRSTLVHALGAIQQARPSTRAAELGGGTPSAEGQSPQRLEDKLQQFARGARQVLNGGTLTSEPSGGGGATYS